MFNKCDKIAPDLEPGQTGALHISAKKGIGLDRLLDRIGETLDSAQRQVEFILPYDRASVLDMLYRKAQVKKADYVPEGIAVTVLCDAAVLGQLKEWVPDWRKKEEWED